MQPWLEQENLDWEQSVCLWIEQSGAKNQFGKLVKLTTVKKRPWSFVQRVQFERGVCYFKACSAAGGHEPALLHFLDRVGFTAVPHTIATNLEQKWLLQQDGGEPCRDKMSHSEQVALLQNLLPEYAKLQIKTMTHLPELPSLGLPDRRLERLPAAFEELLGQVEHGLGEDVVGVGTAVLHQTFSRLQQSPFAAALDHGDLHLGNLLVDGSDYRLCDWGDASITHPFCSLLPLLESVLRPLDVDAREVVGNQLRDAYLQSWSYLADMQQLQAHFADAIWLAHLVRLLDFVHMFTSADAESLKQWLPLIGWRLHFWLGLPQPSGVSSWVNLLMLGK